MIEKTPPEDPLVASSAGARGGERPAVAPARRGRGRPKGSKNRKKNDPLTPSERIGLEESRRIVVEGTDITATKMVDRAQIKTAVTGGTNAQKAHLERVARLEQKERDEEDKYLALAEAYVADLESIEIEDPLLFKRIESRLLPHPADVEVDFEKRVIRVNGPATTLERRRWNAIKNELQGYRARVIKLRSELEADPDCVDRQWHYTRYVCKYLDMAELFSERHRPERLPKWDKIDDIPWYLLDGVGAPVAPAAA